MVSICAVVAARNDLQYLRVLLPLLASQDIDVAILDNESTDESHELYSTMRGKPIILTETLPYHNAFSLSDQLRAKQEIYNKLHHEWVIHMDVDEVLEHHEPGRSLRDAIQEADKAGFNVVNFEEFVFLPTPGTDYCGRDYYRELLRYYYFAPMPDRLHRAWRRDMFFDNIGSAGHRLAGKRLAIFPQNQIMRHYIVLSAEHAKNKYLHRTFSAEDLQRGWHGGRYGNRLHFTQENLALPSTSPYLFELDQFDSKAFRRDSPAPKHFWMWDS